MTLPAVTPPSPRYHFTFTTHSEERWIERVPGALDLSYEEAHAALVEAASQAIFMRRLFNGGELWGIGRVRLVVKREGRCLVVVTMRWAQADFTGKRKRGGGRSARVQFQRRRAAMLDDNDGED